MRSRRTSLDRRCRAFLLLWLVLIVGLIDPTAAETTRIATDEREATGLDLPSGKLVARVYYRDVEEIRALVGYDVWDYNNRREQYVLVLVDATQYLELRRQGFSLEIDEFHTTQVNRAPAGAPSRVFGIPGYPCYRTVEETFVSAQQLADDHPTLASWHDVGDSWEKTQALGGYDMNVLVLTNSAISGPKPVMFVTASIHAREYAPAELATRFAESLLGSYGTDADSTWLLDHHEIHLMLLANPDGRKQAEAGLLWRKNTNQNYCGATSETRGADLNRNFDFQWACCGGSSDDECHTKYHGPAPNSEPETQAIQSYLRSVFPDQRDESPLAAAPTDATGIYIDIHAFGRQVLWPWGFTTAAAPNGNQLQTLGRKLAFFNEYTPEQGYELYISDGTTKDFGYGDLGVASLVYEVGFVHFEDCPVFENEILLRNLPSLLYAAKVARTPYMTPAGPEALEPRAEPAWVRSGATVEISATIDDTRFSSSNGSEPTQSIAAAEFYVDVPPWSTGSSPAGLSLLPADGLFDSGVEAVRGALDTTSLAGGRHLLFVRGRDQDGNWGAFSAAFLFIEDGTEGSIAGAVTDAATGAPLAATITALPLNLSVETDPANGAYSLRLPNGSWSLRAVAPDHMTRMATGVGVDPGGTASVDLALTPAPPVLFVDDDYDAPDVREFYTDALDTIGVEYSVWDTQGSDNEPDSFDLAPFDTVAWFSGGAWGGATGPGREGETALAGWLDGGGCLLVSSQDYFFDRGLTDFMETYLGVLDVGEAAQHRSVQGQGEVFGNLGPYSLEFPYANYSDSVSPNATAALAFTGSNGNAAISRDNGLSRASYWGFGLEAIPTAGDRVDTMQTFLDWCDPLPLLDADQDGVVNDTDCAPLDEGVWDTPSPARNLVVRDALINDLAWTAPLEPGSSTVLYDVLRGGSPYLLSASCLATDSGITTATDGTDPVPGGIFYYVVRVKNHCGTNLGTDATGQRRSGVACF